MIANQMYTIELPTDETFLASSKNIMAIATIFQQAISKHLSIYKKKEIPLSFIEFYIEEIKNYNYMFRKQTKEFFETYERVTPNLDILAKIYIKSYFSQCSELKNIDGENFLILESTELNDFTPEMLDNSDKEIVSSISNLIKITEHINESDEIIPFYENYENFMIAKMVKRSEFTDGNKGKSKVIVNIYNNDDSPQIISATKRAERITSERINISKQKGKVTKIIIPKLKLPSVFPKSSFSRYNSKFRARNFVSASREILILNDLKINGVAYSSNFIDKRNAINAEE